MSKEKKKKSGKVTAKKSPYKNKRIIENFMAASDINFKKKKHVNYVILMENQQLLTSREVYQIKAIPHDWVDGPFMRANWPKEVPVLIHRSKLRGILGTERAKIFWAGSRSTRT